MKKKIIEIIKIGFFIKEIQYFRNCKLSLTLKVSYIFINN